MTPLHSLAFLSLQFCLLAMHPQVPVTAPGQEEAPARAHTFRPPNRSQMAMRMMVRKLLLDRYDANRDHNLDGEERQRLMDDAQAARKERAHAFIRRFDADGDGRLTPEEREAMQQAIARRRRNGSTANEGTPDEAPASHAEGERPARPHQHAGRHPQRGRHTQENRPPRPHMAPDGRMVAFLVHQLTMDAYDADKNGHLDHEESARLREDGDWLYQTREAALSEQYDTNQDGKLSEEELEAALRDILPTPPHHKRAGELPPPPPPHHHRGAIDRMLDTHFDIDILINLARPQAEDHDTPSCSPSTPSAT